MQKINSETSLREAIIQLERKRAFEGALLKEEFRITLEGLKPVNLIKSTLKEVVGSGELKDNVVNASVGAGAGFLIKGKATFVTSGPDYDFMKAKFSWLRATLAVNIDSATQTW